MKWKYFFGQFSPTYLSDILIRSTKKLFPNFTRRVSITIHTHTHTQLGRVPATVFLTIKEIPSPGAQFYHPWRSVLNTAGLLNSIGRRDGNVSMYGSIYCSWKIFCRGGNRMNFWSVVVGNKALRKRIKICFFKMVM